MKVPGITLPLHEEVLMADIFISYASQDRERIKPLINSLESEGWSVWWDRELIAGPSFNNKIQEALDSAKCVVVAWSEHSIHSNWCKDEAQEGLDRGCLVPLRIDDVRPPLGFRSSHTASMVDWPRKTSELESVINGIREVLHPKHTVPEKPPITDTPAGFSSRRAVALLPFRNISGSVALEMAIEGFNEAILGRLEVVEHLRVIARNSTQRFTSRDLDYAEILKILGASQLIVPNIQESRGRIRIQISLISFKPGADWTASFDGNLDDLFGLQDQVVAALMQKLCPEVKSSTQNGNADIATRLRGTENLDAYHAYLKGRSLLAKRKVDSIEPAITELSRAVDLDPMYGNAWGALGLAHLTAGMWGIHSRANSMMIAKETSIRAIGYAPQSQLGYETLSQVQARYEWDFEAALSTIRAGLEAINEADHQLLLNYADLQAKMGNTREALVALESERTSDPLNPGILRSLCLRYIEIGDIGQANASLTALLELDPSHSDRFWLNSKIYLAQKRYQDALDAIANDDLAHLRLSVSAIALFHLGELQDSESVLQELIKEDGEASAFQVAEVYAQRADLRSALHWLEVAYSKRDPGLAELISSTHFKPLYQYSEFREFARRVGLTLK